MRYLKDFLSQADTTKTLIYPHLKCTKQEAAILRYLVLAALDGQSEERVLDVLDAVFGKSTNVRKVKGVKDWSKQEYGDKIERTEHLGAIKSLLDSGWINAADFSFLRDREMGKDMALLELLGLEVSLSSSFHHLLEDGVVQQEVPANTPYTDHLEYLTDQFLRIGLLASLRGKKSAKISSQIRSVEERIQARLERSKSEIPAHKLLKDHHLNTKEEIIFFALLKEEYYGGDGYYRDMSNLIDLVSHNEYEKIQNRALLDEKSTLVEKGLLDYGEVLNPFGGIMRTFFIPEELLRKLINTPKKRRGNKQNLATELLEQDIFELLTPSASFDEVILPSSTRATLESILQQVDSSVVARLREWGIIDKHKGVQAKILFYGAAGTGKTLSAQAIAKALKKQILHFDCSKILSMYVGESEKNVRKIFDTYKDIAQKSKNPPILLLDEADQFLSARMHASSGAEKMHNQMQNIFLEQIERFPGVLVATTNLVESIDSAFSRRFDHKIEFKRPDSTMRVALWEKFLPSNAPYDKGLSASKLAKKLAHYDLSGAQIALVVKNTAYQVAAQKQPVFKEADFVQMIAKEQKGGFDGQKSVGFQVL